MMRSILTRIQNHILAHRRAYALAAGAVAFIFFLALIIGLLWTYVFVYLAMLGFVCFQMIVLSRTLRSASWRWLAAGFVLSFAVTVLLLLLRPSGITWAIWGLSLIRGFGGLACIAIGNHKLRNDLRQTLVDVSRGIRAEQSIMAVPDMHGFSITCPADVTPEQLRDLSVAVLTLAVRKDIERQ